jgi:hypothetical protein
MTGSRPAMALRVWVKPDERGQTAVRAQAIAASYISATYSQFTRFSMNALQ